MAFDMYLDKRHEAIGEHEEYIFSLAAEPPRDFPLLGRVWSKFYSDFTLSPEEAATLVHEFLALHERHATPRSMANQWLFSRFASRSSLAPPGAPQFQCGALVTKGPNPSLHRKNSQPPSAAAVFR